jgi:hypothetical protein
VGSHRGAFLVCADLHKDNGLIEGAYNWNKWRASRYARSQPPRKPGSQALLAVLVLTAYGLLVYFFKESFA